MFGSTGDQKQVIAIGYAAISASSLISMLSYKMDGFCCIGACFAQLCLLPAAAADVFKEPDVSSDGDWLHCLGFKNNVRGAVPTG